MNMTILCPNCGHAELLQYSDQFDPWAPAAAREELARECPSHDPNRPFSFWRRQAEQEVRDARRAHQGPIASSSRSPLRTALGATLRVVLSPWRA